MVTRRAKSAVAMIKNVMIGRVGAPMVEVSTHCAVSKAVQRLR